jgi:hypothetical protein
LTEADRQLAHQALNAALDRFRTAAPPEDPTGVRLQLTVHLREPGVVDFTLLLTARRTGILLGGHSVRASGESTRQLLRAGIGRIVEDAAEAMAWTEKPERLRPPGR